MKDSLFDFICGLICIISVMFIGHWFIEGMVKYSPFKAVGRQIDKAASPY